MRWHILWLAELQIINSGPRLYLVIYVFKTNLTSYRCHHTHSYYSKISIPLQSLKSYQTDVQHDNVQNLFNTFSPLSQDIKVEIDEGLLFPTICTSKSSTVHWLANIVSSNTTYIFDFVTIQVYRLQVQSDVIKFVVIWTQGSLCIFNLESRFAAANVRF